MPKGGKLESVKHVLHQKCIDLCNDRLETLNKAFLAQKEALNGESKSSAGDKYETSRAMAHLEQEKLSKQYDEVINQKRILESIIPDQKHDVIESGSVVETSSGTFYISVGLGKVDHAGIQVFAISPGAPIAQVMLGLKQGDSIVFKGEKWRIISIE